MPIAARQGRVQALADDGDGRRRPAHGRMPRRRRSYPRHRHTNRRAPARGSASTDHRPAQDAWARFRIDVRPQPPRPGSSRGLGVENDAVILVP